MISAMLNARYFAQFLIPENPNAIPVRIDVGGLDSTLGAALLDVDLRHFGERVKVTKGSSHPSEITFVSWDRTGSELAVETKFRLRNVAGIYQFACTQGAWKLVEDSVREYKPKS